MLKFSFTRLSPTSYPPLSPSPSLTCPHFIPSFFLISQLFQSPSLTFPHLLISPFPISFSPFPMFFPHLSPTPSPSPHLSPSPSLTFPSFPFLTFPSFPSLTFPHLLPSLFPHPLLQKTFYKVQLKTTAKPQEQIYKLSDVTFPAVIN